MSTKATIMFRGDRGRPESHLAKTIIKGVLTDAALQVLQAALAAHTNCNIAKTSHQVVTTVDLTAPGVDANVDKRATVYFQDPDDDTIHSITIPAPVDSDIDFTNPNGDRLTMVAVNFIVSYLNTATGKSYNGLYGVVETLK